MDPQNNQPDPHWSPAAPEVSSESVYTVADTAYAWLSLLFAFLFCQTVPVWQHPLGGFLLIVALYGSGFLILRLKKVTLCPACILSAVSALVIGSALLLTDTEFLIKLSLTYCLASYCYFLYAAFGNRIEKGFSNYIYMDFIRILFVFPFASLTSLFPALSSNSAKKGSAFLVKSLAGIAIAIIPTGMVFFLLSYDSGFNKLLSGILSFATFDVSRIIVSLLFTLPLAMYGFGLYFASQGNSPAEETTVESCNERLQKAQIMPQLTALVAILPILFLYGVFFISQWKYYVSGFTGVLPEGFSYAEYARKGFFELCSVSVINLIMIVAIAFFIKRTENGSCVILKFVATALCLCTLILISTAIAKLVMYIDSYGLTQKRIYALWLMILIAIAFPIIAVSQFLRKSKAVALCLAVAIVMFAGLSVCNVNALCARYNTDRYLSGSLESIDVEAMDDLGDSAIPSLVRLANTMDAGKDPELKQQVDSLLREKIAEFEKEDVSFFSFRVPSALAKAALKDYTPPATPIS